MKLLLRILALSAITLSVACSDDDGPTGTGFDVNEECVEDECGTCDNDPSNDCVQDCAGEWGGDAVEDACGTCDADPANDCVEDCAGVAGGAAVEDMCGTCDDVPENDCEQDCAGEWGGDAVEDGCGTCDNDPDNDCPLDCAGAPDGDAVEDMCGTCDADPDNDCVQDCAGTWGGMATEDACGTCDDDPDNDCVQDCAGEWGGDAVEDNCGTCDNDASNDCVQDCAGAWGGDAVEDNCGTCDNDASNDCTADCSGTFGGTATVDPCGICVGGTTGRASTCQTATMTLEADAYVRERSPDTTYGTAAELQIAPNWNSNNQLEQTYLRFDLGSLPNNAIILGAKLRMVAKSGWANGGDGNVYAYAVANDTWDEATINWTNKPGADGTQLGYWWLWYDRNISDKVGENTSGALAEYLKRQFFEDKKASLMLASPGYETNYYSKESGATGKTPSLEVHYMLGQQASVPPVADTYVHHGNADANYDSATALFVSPAWSGITSREYRTFLRFNLASIPANATIHRARLTMTARRGWAYGGNGNVYTYATDDAWDSTTLTWNNMPTVDTTSHLGYWWLWYDRTIVDKVGVNDSPTLAAHVAREHAGDGTASFMLSSGGYETEYYSNENAAAAKRPVLIVDYTN